MNWWVTIWVFIGVPVGLAVTAGLAWLIGRAADSKSRWPSVLTALAILLGSALFAGYLTR